MIDFSNLGYKYIGNHQEGDDTNNYKYDANKAKQMLADKRYNDLADYLANYQLNDIDADAQQRNRIAQLRTLGNRTQAYYSKLESSEVATVDFANSVFSPGGLKNLRMQSTTDSNGNLVPKYKTEDEFKQANPEAASYINSLSELGSFNGRTATGLKLTFSDKKYGMFGIDWLKKDYNEYYDVLSKSGLTEKELQALGGRIEKKDGEISIEFDKNADCATRILNSIDDSGMLRNAVKIVGLDSNGEIPVDERYIYSNPIDPTGNSFSTLSGRQRDFLLINNMKRLVSESNGRKKAVEVKRSLDTKLYSSTLFDIRTDRTDVLDEQLANGEISQQQYNTLRKEARGINIQSALQADVFGTYPIYTDYFGKENYDNPNSEIRHLVENGDQWDELRNIIKGAKPSDITYLGETSNGQVGLHISIKPNAAYSHAGNKVKYTDKPIQIFIPGLLTEEIENQMNAQTGIRAIKEWNSMIDYGYNYQKQDGTQIGVDEKGNVFRYVGDQITVDNSSDAKERAIREINEDYIKQDANRLKYQFMNVNGDIDFARYNNVSKIYVTQAVNELYQGVELEDIEGNSLYKDDNGKVDLNKLFSNDTRMQVYTHPEDFQYQTLEKLKKLYELYDFLTVDLLRGNNLYVKAQNR